MSNETALVSGLPERAFAAAAKEYFGFLPGQNVSSFGAELKKLTPQDREEMRPGLEAALNCRIKV